MSTISSFDIVVLSFVNQGLASPLLDTVMICLSHPFLWAAIAFAFIIHALKTRSRRLLTCVLALFIGITFADLICFEVLKPFFGRARPCHDPAVFVRAVLSGCGGILGMPSNHAANGMTVAVVGWSFLGRRWGFFMAMVALMVGVSRVYLGVHYPSDVLTGLALGPIFGLPAVAIARRTIKEVSAKLSKLT